MTRQAELKDSKKILSLMIDLAEFEGYADQFIVTLNDLDKRLFKNKDFCVLVSEVDQQVVAILVYYYLPFTYDLKPWIYIKELFVDQQYRSLGLGKQLMIKLAKEAIENKCSKIRWDVLSTNLKATKFYQSLGAKHDKEWLLFNMDEANLKKLANNNG